MLILCFMRGLGPFIQEKVPGMSIFFGAYIILTVIILFIMWIRRSNGCALQKEPE